MIINTSKILYINNIEKQIIDVNIGDVIIGYSEKTKEFVEVEVLSKKSKEYDKIIQLTFKDDSILKITEEHPILTKEGWASYNIEESKKRYLIDCKELKVGCEVLTKENIFKAIKDINVLNEKTTCYTLDVTDSVDTYIADGIVVHNPPYGITFQVKPVTLTDLTVTNNPAGGNMTYTLADVHEIYNDELIIYGFVPTSEPVLWTFSSTGYVTQSNIYITEGMDVHVVLEPNIITCTRDSSKDTQDIFYTTSATPSVGDTIYNEDKEDTGKTISAVGSGWIEWMDNVTLTIIPHADQSETLKYGNSGLRINDGQNYMAPNFPTEPFVLTPGESITLYAYMGDPTGPISISESSSSAIPTGQLAAVPGDAYWRYITFVMPAENAVITIDYNWQGPF